MRVAFLGVLGLLLVQGAQAQNVDEYNLACIKSMVAPTYPQIARQARIVGTVNVQITISDVGGAEKIQVDSSGSQRLLEEASKESVRKAQYDPSCAGRVVRVQFAFEIHEELPPVSGPSTITQFVFRGPNVFVIGIPPTLINF